MHRYDDGGREGEAHGSHRGMEAAAWAGRLEEQKAASRSPNTRKVGT